MSGLLRLLVLLMLLELAPAIQAGNPDQKGKAGVAAGRVQASWSSPAQRRLEKRAAAGDLSAQYFVGMDLLNGDFGTPNPELALGLFQAAAKRGFSPAMLQVGRMHRDGLGTSANPFKAVEWFREAVAAGFRPAQIDLALMLLEGKGSHQDLIEAYVLLESASPTITLAPPGDFAQARKILPELGRSLTPEQMNLARKRLAENRDQSLSAMMRRHPSVAKGKR